MFDSQKAKQPRNQRDWLTFARKISVIYLVIGSILFIAIGASCSAAPGTYICMRPNEFGDLLAGVFAPLAFAWLAVAVLIQAQELSAQREELSLTRLEFEQQRQVLKEQATFIGEQTRLLADESALRAAAEVDRVFEARLEDLAPRFDRLVADAWYVAVDAGRSDKYYMRRRSQDDGISALRLMCRRFDRLRAEGALTEAPASTIFAGLASEVGLLSDLVGAMTPSGRERASALDLGGLHKELIELTKFVRSNEPKIGELNQQHPGA